MNDLQGNHPHKSWPGRSLIITWIIPSLVDDLDAKNGVTIIAVLNIDQNDVGEVFANQQI